MSLLSVVFSDAREVGKIIEATGKVQIIKKGSFKGIDYSIYKGIIEEGDVVRTKRNSYAKIRFIDKTEVLLDEKSRLVVEKYELRNASLYATTGKVIYKIYKKIKGSYKIKTPTTIIGVKGTKLATIIKPSYTLVILKEGLIEVNNPKFPDIKLTLTEGKATVVRANMPPSKPKKVEDIDKIFSIKAKKKVSNKTESVKKRLYGQQTKTLDKKNQIKNVSKSEKLQEAVKPEKEGENDSQLYKQVNTGKISTSDNVSIDNIEENITINIESSLLEKQTNIDSGILIFEPLSLQKDIQEVQIEVIQQDEDIQTQISELLDQEQIEDIIEIINIEDFENSNINVDIPTVEIPDDIYNTQLNIIIPQTDLPEDINNTNLYINLPSISLPSE